jgi:hypothetical protein
MKTITAETLLRFSLGLILMTMGSICAAQQASQQPQQQSTQRDQYRDQAQSTMQDLQQKETESFPGTISEKYKKYYLERAFTRASYELVGTWDVQRFVGKKVRITGWLDSDHNILHVVAIAKTP